MSMTDPTADPQGGAGQGTGAGDPPDPRDAEIQRLKAENAEAREKNRGLNAKALGAEHRLSPTQVELLGRIDLDQQGEFAGKLAEEAKGQAPAPTPPAGEPAAPATPEPPAQPDPGTDPALQHMATGGEAVPGAQPVAVGWRAQMNEELNKAESFDDFTRIQQKYNEIRQREVEGG